MSSRGEEGFWKKQEGGAIFSEAGGRSILVDSSRGDDYCPDLPRICYFLKYLGGDTLGGGLNFVIYLGGSDAGGNYVFMIFLLCLESR